MLRFEPDPTIKDALERVVKPENIIDDDTILEGYSRDHSFIVGQVPRFAVFPENKEELQSVVKLANESRIPLIPVSSGPPRFHGDTVPDSVAL
jgi:FAD/FMN-containing dehydrogenase